MRTAIVVSIIGLVIGVMAPGQASAQACNLLINVERGALQVLSSCDRAAVVAHIQLPPGRISELTSAVQGSSQLSGTGKGPFVEGLSEAR